MNRLHLLLAAAVVAASASVGAQSRAYEPKSLARYDVSYGRCEKMYPDMKGHRDEAYLSLWRATLNDKTKGRLAEARASAAYKAEREIALAGGVKSSAPDAATTLEHECRALRGELKRATTK
jgi:hypothetical protein